MNSSAPLRAIQARQLPTPARAIGMDFMSPFWVYVDGVEFSSFPTIQEAESVYAELRKKLRQPVFEVH